jgi:hypothetical protein
MPKAIVQGHDKLYQDLSLHAGNFNDGLEYSGGDDGYLAIANLTPAQLDTIEKLGMGWVHWYLEVEEDGSVSIKISP